MAITPTGHTFEVFGSLAKNKLTELWWLDHQGAVVFPTDENKVYFAGKAYDGMSSEQLQTLLNSTYGIIPSADHTTPTSDPTKTNGYYTVAEIKYLLTKYQTVLTQAANAGSGINIATVNGQPTISVKIDTSVDNSGLNVGKNGLSLVRAENIAFGAALFNHLTAGDGISISQSGKKIQISANLDLSLYTIVNELPTSNILENKIYLVVNAETGTNNTYKEYIYVDNNWELLGEYKAEVNLSNYVEFDDLENSLAEYYNKSEADDKFTLSGTTISGTKTEVKDNVISAAIIIQ